MDFPGLACWTIHLILQAASNSPSRSPCDLRCLVPQRALCKRRGGRGNHWEKPLEVFVVFSEDVEEIQEKPMGIWWNLRRMKIDGWFSELKNCPFSLRKVLNHLCSCLETFYGLVYGKATKNVFPGNSLRNNAPNELQVNKLKEVVSLKPISIISTYINYEYIYISIIYIFLSRITKLIYIH